jgi:hypothetical protein
MSYTGIHQYKLLFDLEHRTFQLASAATREIWFIVIHPIVAPAVELLSQRACLKKQAQSAQTSALQHHHAEALASYIKKVFLSGGFTGERVELSWTLNSPLLQKLTYNKWTMFQERFIEDWPQHVTQHSYDIFWTQNQPAFYTYDYGANIEITVSDCLQSLGRETCLCPDDDPAEDPDDKSHSDIESGSMLPAREDDTGLSVSQTQPHTADDWPLDLDSSPNTPDSLYSGSLWELSAELDQKYDLNNISCMSYTLAVDLHCLDSSTADPDQQTAFCMLAD